MPATSASASTASPAFTPDDGLADLLNEFDPARIEATIQRLVQFGTRLTASSQTDPVRGIGAATTWVAQQMQAIAANVFRPDDRAEGLLSPDRHTVRRLTLQ